MKRKLLFWLLVPLCSSVLAQTLTIEDFYDRRHAFVSTPEGTLVPFGELGIEPPFDIVGKESGQYLFNGPKGKQYRVYIPEVITNQSEQLVIHCDQTPVVFADDHQIASARGVGEDCP